MADGDVAFFSGELPDVFAFDHRVVEHQRCADKIDAVVAKVLEPLALVPFVHEGLDATPLAGRTTGFCHGESLLARERK